MKKLFYVAAFLTIASQSVNAQSRVKIGPEASLNYVNMLQTVDDKVYNVKPQFGFRIGAVADIEINESKFYVQPGIGLSFNNGTESKYESYYATGSGFPTSLHDIRKYHVLSVNAPIYFVYKTGQYFDDPHFFVGLGVFTSANIGGRFEQEYKTILNGVERTQFVDRAIYIGNERVDDDIAIFDVGPSACIGFELPSGLFFRGFFNYGLLNQAPGNKSVDKWQNMGGGLSVGFLIPTRPGQTWGWR